MDIISSIASKLPSVIKPIKKLTFKEKGKWTLIILVLYFILGSITIWGINSEAVAQFEFLEIVFGSKFGSIITLGIGPIVTASIILQLLVGSKIIPWDLSKEDDKKKFMGIQKILAVLFCLIEAIAYVAAGAIPPASTSLFIVTAVILQLTFGGILIIFMDEVCSKWGFGSGISLFIAAGVSKTIFVRALNPLAQGGVFPSPGNPPSGLIPGMITSLMDGQIVSALFSLLPLIATLVVLLIVVYAQSIRVEIPMAFTLPFGKLAARRWPLKFFYTSNIPVILTAAVIANIQVMGRVLYSRGISILGIFNQQGRPESGLAFYLTHPSSASLVIICVLGSLFALGFVLFAMRMWKKYAFKMAILGGVIGLALGFIFVNTYNLPVVTSTDILRGIIYMIAFIIGSIIFSIFWTSTSGMDAKSVAEQFKASSLMIPGFRRDPRIVEKVLNRYIPALTVMGGAFVGFLAGFADLTSALGTGTGILLTVMIVYQFYEQISAQHYEDIPPAIRKFMGD